MPTDPGLGDTTGVRHTHHVDFLFVFEERAPVPVTVRSYRLAFRPFRLHEIDAALTAAGLTPVDVTRKSGFVAIVTVPACPPAQRRAPAAGPERRSRQQAIGASGGRPRADAERDRHR